jgi:hypothetical protein
MESLALLSLLDRDDVDAESSAKQVSHLSLEERADDELMADSLIFDDPPRTSEYLKGLPPPLPKSWSEILSNWTFGHNRDHDPSSDPLIAHFIQSKVKLHSPAILSPLLCTKD